MKPQFLFLLLLPFGAMAQEVREFSLPVTYAYTDAGEQTDTLTLRMHEGEPMFDIYWRGDSIATEWNYGTLPNFISSMSAWGAGNSYLIQTHAGDGCPSLYRILSIKEDGTPHLTDYFGNCNEFSEYRWRGNRVEFSFAADKEVQRTKVTVQYYPLEYKMVEK